MIRCPECLKGHAIYVRDVFEWEETRGWRRLFGWGARRRKTGECAVCMEPGCNTPFIVTPGGPIQRTQELPVQRRQNGPQPNAKDMLAEFERGLNVGAEEP